MQTGRQYQSSVALMEEGKYEEAIAAFESLDEYGDSTINTSEYKDEFQEKAIERVHSLKDWKNIGPVK